MPASDLERKSFVTSDGVELSYIDAGEGAPLVMLHGWSQCADEFGYQIGALIERNRVIVPDQRGHGRSDKPAHGFRVSRLAQDVDEFLEFLEIDRTVMLGHSMGCSVIWAYCDQNGTDRISKLVLVDEPPCVAINPFWTTEKIAETGSMFQPTTAFDVAHALSGPEGEQATRDMISSMFTPGCRPEIVEWVIECNLLMPRDLAARLLLSNIFNDWRDIIPRLRMPTLVIGGEASGVSSQSTRWIADHIAGAQLEIFAADEGGSHFMFIENADKFNRVVSGFLAN